MFHQNFELAGSCLPFCSQHIRDLGHGGFQADTDTSLLLFPVITCQLPQFGCHFFPLVALVVFFSWRYSLRTLWDWEKKRKCRSLASVSIKDKSCFPGIARISAASIISQLTGSGKSWSFSSFRILPFPRTKITYPSPSRSYLTSDLIISPTASMTAARCFAHARHDFS